MDRRQLANIVLGLLVLTGLTYAANEQFAYSPATFTVSTSYAFTVTLKGGSPVTSNTTYVNAGTNRMYFNTTTGTNSSILPCTDLALTACQNVSHSIVNFTNIGTNAINLSVKMNESLETGISLWYNASCNGTGCTSASSPTVVQIAAATGGADWTTFCHVLPVTAGNWAGLWLYANFSNVAGGTYAHWIDYNSSTTP